MFLCNSNIGNVLVTSEFFFYWKLLYTIAYKVIKNEYIRWMFFCWDTQQDRKIFPAVGFAFRIVKDNIAISYTFVTPHQTLPMI